MSKKEVNGNNGMLEYGNIRRKGVEKVIELRWCEIFPVFHSSNIPIFQCILGGIL
jgi:hypothetical protein